MDFIPLSSRVKNFNFNFHHQHYYLAAHRTWARFKVRTLIPSTISPITVIDGQKLGKLSAKLLK